MDIQDMGQRTERGNRYLLASKILFGFLFPTKEAMGVAEVVLDVVLTFSLPLSLRSDPSTEFTAEVVKHLYRWLNVY